jgi:uncharacterized protein (DUF1330 family)
MTVTVNGMLSGVLYDLAAVATRKPNKSKEIRMTGMLEPTPEQFAALAARPADTPVVMVNLLKFKTAGGLEAYQQYGREVAPHLQRVGATLRYAGEAPELVIGDGERPWWDAILLVEYPTPQAFIDMVTTAEYAKVHEHRAAGLERGDLIATSEWSMAGP